MQVDEKVVDPEQEEAGTREQGQLGRDAAEESRRLPL